MISSPGNMRFWLHLCQASKAVGAEEAIQGFSTAAKAGKETSAAYCHEYNTELMRKVTTHFGIISRCFCSTIVQTDFADSVCNELNAFAVSVWPVWSQQSHRMAINAAFWRCL